MNHKDVVQTLESNRRMHIAYAWSIVRNHFTAEDLCQELSVTAIQRVDSFEDLVHLLKWSRVTLRNKALEHLRKEKLLPLNHQLLETLDSHWDNADTNRARERTAALRHCLEKLSPGARRMIELRYGQGLKGTEVAMKTKRKVHTVYVALSRAYSMLGECIGKQIGGETKT